MIGAGTDRYPARVWQLNGGTAEGWSIGGRDDNPALPDHPALVSRQCRPMRRWRFSYAPQTQKRNAEAQGPMSARCHTGTTETA